MQNNPFVKLVTSVLVHGVVCWDFKWKLPFACVHKQLANVRRYKQMWYSKYVIIKGFAAVCLSWVMLWNLSDRKCFAVVEMNYCAEGRINS